MSKEVEEKAIRQLLDDTFKAETDGNLEKYLSFFHEDLVSLPPGIA